MAQTEITGRNTDALSLNTTELSKALLWRTGNLEPDRDRMGTSCCVLSLVGKPRWREMKGCCELCPRARAQLTGSALYTTTQDDMGPVEYDSCSGWRGCPQPPEKHPMKTLNRTLGEDCEDRVLKKTLRKLIPHEKNKSAEK